MPPASNCTPGGVGSVMILENTSSSGADSAAKAGTTLMKANATVNKPILKCRIRIKWSPNNFLNELGFATGQIHWQEQFSFAFALANQLRSGTRDLHSDFAIEQI